MQYYKCKTFSIKMHASRLICGSFFFLIIFILALIWKFYGFPLILDRQVDKNFRLKNGTRQWDRFVQIPFPFIFNAYIFNVTNPDEILNGSKPIVQEIGPYCYNQYRKKSILAENATDDTVTYTQKMHFEFNNEESYPLKDDDVLTVLNPAILTIFEKASSYQEKRIIHHYMNKIFEDYSSLFVQIKVKDLLFDGINFATETTGFQDTIYNLAAVKIRYLSESLRNAVVYKNEDEMGTVKFSILSYKNDSTDGNYTIFRGNKNISKLGDIQKWNGSSRIQSKFWGSNNNCSKIYGNDATIFAPHRIINDGMVSFITDICRTVQLDYTGTREYKGVTGYLYQTNNRTFWSRTKNPENDCYCVKSVLGLDGKPSCFLDGVIDVSRCFDAPIIVSHPHFLWADEKYLKAVRNLHPNEEKHRIYAVVEPTTGIPLEGMKRAQVNLVLRPELPFPKVRSTLFPLLWIEEGILLDQQYIDELNTEYFNILTIINSVSYVIIFCSLIAYITLAFYAVKNIILNRANLKSNNTEMT